MTQITALPIGSTPPRDWWRRISTAVNLLLGEVADLYRRPTNTVTANYMVGDGDYAVFADASGGAFTVTLPPVVEGRELLVKKIDSSNNAVTVSGQVDGSATTSLTAQWQSLRLIGGSSSWLKE